MSPSPGQQQKPVLHVFLDNGIREAAPGQPLYDEDRLLDVHRNLVLRHFVNHPLVIREHDVRRSRLALVVCDDFDAPVLVVADAGVRRARSEDAEREHLDGRRRLDVGDARDRVDRVDQDEDELLRDVEDERVNDKDDVLLREPVELVDWPAPLGREVSLLGRTGRTLGDLVLEEGGLLLGDAGGCADVEELVGGPRRLCLFLRVRVSEDL